MLHGPKIVAVAVVAQAVWGMARNLCTDAPRVTIMAIVASLAVLVPSAWVQIGLIAAAGTAGLLFAKPAQTDAKDMLPIGISRRSGTLWLALFFVLLAGLPVLAHLFPYRAVALADAFYRSGALVFDGGHVVLPLLQAEVVPTGWIDNETFLAGYGAAQALPGPMFSFAAFLGATMDTPPAGWSGALLCLLAVYLPSFLLVVGALPFWEQLRHSLRVQAALSGINAAVVGLLLAALYHPLWTSTIHQARDFSLALLALVALTSWKLPPWLLVLISGTVGWLFDAAA